ncbi:hypothetical protein [Rhodopirellula halodulae]|uniref:hypothetical protein n=1 Tax=Rhodopirellula halodulae TaxID=2894198 RepID=UPI001E52F33D|nr:hypothetical protein [Rhodopirellula sp. JC737]MCC9657796.1 hypothetical protein [Rhodopirellula sp. JC737]
MRSLTWILAGLCFVGISGVATSLTAEDEPQSEERSAESRLPDEVSERLAEMAMQDSDDVNRLNALQICQRVLSGEDLKPVVLHCLEDTNFMTASEAFKSIAQIGLSDSDQVDLAIAHARLVLKVFQYKTASSLDADPCRPVMKVLREHPELTGEKLIALLEQDDQHAEVHLMLLQACQVKLTEKQDLLLQLSKSESKQVRRAVIGVWESQTEPEKSAQHSLESIDKDSKFYRYAERILKRYDKDGSGSLNESEAETMLLKPFPADANKDGEVTVSEYAHFMEQRSKR